jgi:hypothetical protein
LLAQTGKDVALAALEDQLVTTMSEVPCLDEQYIREAVEANNFCWAGIPQELQESEAFARSITQFSDDTARAVLQKHPTLCHDRSVWLTVIGSNCKRMHRFLEQFAPMAICSDRELMLKAGCFDRDILALVEPNLHTDRTFLDLVLDAQPLALYHVSHEAQRLFPDLLVRKLAPLKHLSDSVVYGKKLARRIDPALWWDRNFVETWFRTGLPFVLNSHQHKWKTDRTLFLLVAEHCSPLHAEYSFGFACETLLNDKAFMTQIVELNPLLIKCLLHNSHLRHDFDLVLLSLAGSGDAAREYLIRSPMLEPTINPGAMVRMIDDNLALHDSFVKTIVCSTSTVVGTSVCPLSLLSQGTETSANYMLLIAEYLGVPTGRKLRLLRRAEENLKSVDE